MRHADDKIIQTATGPKIVQTANTVGASGALMYHAFTAPLQPAVIEIAEGTGALPAREGVPAIATKDTKQARRISASPSFNLVVLVVAAITILAMVAQALLAGIWTNPTPMQQSAFDAMATAWKMGLGGLVGLLGGKVSR